MQMAYIETIFYSDPVPIIQYLDNQGFAIEAFVLGDDKSMIVLSQQDAISLSQYLSNREENHCQSWVQLVDYDPSSKSLLLTLAQFGEVEEAYMGFDNVIVVRTLSACSMQPPMPR